MLEQIIETYNIHYLRMDDAKWRGLAQVYEQLPGFIGYHEDIPYWFGMEQNDTEKEARHLSASVEPSGLLVEGELEPQDWARWQQVFLPLAATALGFVIKPAEEDNEWPYAVAQPNPMP